MDFLVPWVGLHLVIVVFPDHTHYLFDYDWILLLLVGEDIAIKYAR